MPPNYSLRVLIEADLTYPLSLREAFSFSRARRTTGRTCGALHSLKELAMLSKHLYFKIGARVRVSVSP